MTNPAPKYDAAANSRRMFDENKQLRGEVLLARAVIHALMWESSVIITEQPRLRDALKAWGQADKLAIPRNGEAARHLHAGDTGPQH